MLRLILILCHLLSVLAACVTPLPAANDWEDPEVIGRNKLAPTATMFRFATAEQAMKGSRDESPYVKLLGGDWKFKYVGTPDERPTVIRGRNHSIGFPSNSTPFILPFESEIRSVCLEIGLAMAIENCRNDGLHRGAGECMIC